MGVGGQRHAPAALPPKKTRYPLYRRLGGPHGRSGRVRKSMPPPGFDPQTVQPVASGYTDWAIPAYKVQTVSNKTSSLAIVNIADPSGLAVQGMHSHSAIEHWDRGFETDMGHDIYIQGVTGGTDQTSGECSLGQTIPI